MKILAILCTILLVISTINVIAADDIGPGDNRLKKEIPPTMTNETLPGNDTHKPPSANGTIIHRNDSYTKTPGNITNDTPTLPGNITNTTFPGNDTPTLPGNITYPGTDSNATVPVYGEETIPMQNTGMPLTPLIAALITIGGALLYPRYKK